MPTFYLDPVGGNDANDGTTFANRWKTFNLGATGARIAPGDTIRVMASPAPTLVGSCGWTNNAGTVTVPSGIYKVIEDGSTWTASANVTTSNAGSKKGGASGPAAMTIAAAFTTGKVAYKALGSTMDLSAFQQISMWMQTSPLIAQGVFTLALCSDTTGDVPVATITFDWGTPQALAMTAMVKDFGSALPSNVNSIALYAVSDPGSVSIQLNNITACKAPSAADSLTHLSLIGKNINLPWAAGATYAVGDRRRPTPPNRNNLQYAVTAITTGVSAGTEPAWPDYLGGIVVDGGVTWTATEVEDTWYPVSFFQSGADTIQLDAGGNNNTSGITTKYQGATETVATYKREPFVAGPSSSAATSLHSIQDSGTGNTPLVFSGGWNRTDMSTQTDESWFEGVNGSGFGMNTGLSVVCVRFSHLNYSRVTRGFVVSGMAGGVGGWMDFNSCAAVACSDYGFTPVSVIDMRFRGFHLIGTGTFGTNTLISGGPRLDFQRSRFEAVSGGYGFQVAAAAALNAATIRMEDCYIRGNGLVGFRSQGGVYGTFFGCKFANNSTDVEDFVGGLRFQNCLFGSATEVNASGECFIFSGNHDQTSGSHKAWAFGCNVVSDNAVRHAATGIAWKFTVTNIVRGSNSPAIFPLAQLVVTAGQNRNISIWGRRSNANIAGKLRVRGGQVAGVNEVTASVAPVSLNTWEQSSSLTVTPTDNGVIEVELLVWDGVGTSNNFWVDDLTVT
jgi:hypothetical protein